MLTPTNPTIALGQTQRFSAIGIYSDNTTADITTLVAWSSDNPTVAIIGATGLAQAIGVGSTVIRATRGSISGSTVLSVAPPPSLLSQASFSASAYHIYFTSDNAVGNVPVDFRPDWVVMFPSI